MGAFTHSQLPEGQEHAPSPFIPNGQSETMQLWLVDSSEKAWRSSQPDNRPLLCSTVDSVRFPANSLISRSIGSPSPNPPLLFPLASLLPSYSSQCQLLTMRSCLHDDTLQSPIFFRGCSKLRHHNNEDSDLPCLPSGQHSALPQKPFRRRTDALTLPPKYATYYKKQKGNTNSQQSFIAK